MAGRGDLGGGEGVGGGGVALGTWAESLAAELLYSRPDVRPADVASVAADAMRRYGSAVVWDDYGDDGKDGVGTGGGEGGDEARRDWSSSFESIVLGVMRGDAGRAVETLHKYGGGSGAALPATMVRFFMVFRLGRGGKEKTERSERCAFLEAPVAPPLILQAPAPPPDSLDPSLVVVSPLRLPSSRRPRACAPDCPPLRLAD